MKAIGNRIARLEEKAGVNERPQVSLRQILGGDRDYETEADVLTAAHKAAYPDDAKAEFLVIQRVVI